jgi:hypothetical protein
MKVGGVCPVCEIPHDAALAPARPEPAPAPGVLQRHWDSGRLPVIVAVLCFAAAVFLPLARGVRLRNTQGREVVVDVQPYDLASATYPALHGRMTAWFLPGAALFLLSMLRSRRTGSAMAASRPVVAVVSLAPLISAVMPFLLLKKHGQSPDVGPAALVILLGVVLGVLGATRFGQGVPEKPRPGSDEDVED